MDGSEPRESVTTRLPTMSRLPQGRPGRASMLMEPGTFAAARSNATSAPAKRSSMILPPGFNVSPKKLSAAFSPPQNHYTGGLKGPVAISEIYNESKERETYGDSVLASPTKQMERTSSPEDIVSPRQARPSLSDRTMESLSAVSPAPSASRRRQSGFFASESPMKPPSRATSALGYSRPSSRMSSTGIASGINRSRQPPSPSKGTTATYIRPQSSGVPSANSATVVGKRSISGGTGIKSPTSMQAPQTFSRLAHPGTALAKASNTNRASMIGSKTIATRPTGARSPVKDVFGPSLIKANPKTTSTGPNTLAYNKAPLNGQRKPAIPRTAKSPSPEIEHPADPAFDRKIAKSSQALRSTIQQARQRMQKTPNDAFLPRSVAEDNFQAFGIALDPRSMDLQDSAHVNIIRKRINMAKSDGKLNISMLCLKEMPTEVLKMYEPGNDSGGPSWYESVDITRLNAADNEFAELPDSIFALPVSTDDESIERESHTGIFAGLVAIDFHTNQLACLPQSLGMLTQLTSLNLSQNQLESGSIDLLSSAHNLKELRLSQNQLKGPIPASIGNLQHLEILDLRGNAITELPATLGNLPGLKILDVSANQLTRLPMEAIFDLHLTEINASRNRLSEALIPANVPLVPYLQKLNLSTNALTSLADVKVDFPMLEHLDISNNRVSALPNVSSWQKLSYFNAEENKISEVPAGFSSLKELVHADFGNNSLLELDDSIGLMEKLSKLNLTNNPIKERRLAKITTEELKIELLGRTSGMSSPGSRSNGITPQFSSFAQAMSWTITGDTLDRSNSKLKTIDRADLEPLTQENVRQAILHHNQLQTIPVTLGSLANTLVSIDLSSNKLDKGQPFLRENLTLPNLQTLNLTLNGLTTLDPLVRHLQAKKLATLIVTFNKITTLPDNPSLTSAFPSLTKLVATNNKIVSLDVNSLRGLQVLDVSSNDIEALPPQLALLEGTLRTLMVTGNKFRVPNWGVLEKGTEEVLKWCRRQIPRGEEGALEAAW